MITLSLDAPEPWATNLHRASAGWPPGVSLQGPNGAATITAALRDAASARVAAPAPGAGTASAAISARRPMSPDRLNAWARRSVRHVADGDFEWEAAEQVHETVLPQGPSAVRTTRRELQRMFAHSSRVDDLVLAGSELAANAVQHGSGPTRLGVVVDAGTVVIEVGDHDPTLWPTVLPLQRASWSGRGMAIVDTITEYWGVLALSTGKVVWCEFIDVATAGR